MTYPGADTRHWWSSTPVVLALLALITVPLLWPTIPPLLDLPGHMGRYRVQLDYNTSAVLRSYYAFNWSLIGNLGVDLLIIPMARLFGLELGVKLIVIAIPLMTAAGLLWIAREVHGRIPPTAAFALPLAYGHPFMYGFVNFSLSMALAMLAFALWLRLGRKHKQGLRAVLFLVIAPMLWVAHTFGWATLCVLAFSAEIIRQHDRTQSWSRAIWDAGIQCLSLAPPIVLMLAWRSGQVSGQTADWFDWDWKWRWLTATLRDRWYYWDLWSMVPLVLVPLIAFAWRGLTFSRNLLASSIFLAITYVCLPRIVFGSNYADMRLTPFIFMILIIAIRARPDANRLALNVLAVSALAFFGMRMWINTDSLYRSSVAMEVALGALDHVPEGARLVTLIGSRCGVPWALNRNMHIAGIALVRRRAYANDHWDMAGGQLMRSIKFDAGKFASDPSQIIVASPCRDKWYKADWSLANLPRAAFDYLWLVEPVPFDPALLRDMTLIWHSGPNALYRIDHSLTEKQNRD